MSGEGHSSITSMPSLAPMNRVRDDTPLSVGWQPSEPAASNIKAMTPTRGTGAGDAAEEDEYVGQPPFVFTTGDDDEEGEISS